jgi:ketosteroid isomerase-like protein
MGEQQNTEIVRQTYAAFGRGDIPALLDLLDDAIEWEAVIGAAPHVPTAGKRHGKQAVAEFFRVLSETIEFIRFEPREFIAQGDQVVTLGSYEGRSKATGRTFAEEWAMVDTIRNGKVVRFREYVNAAAINAAFEAAGV